MPSFRFQNAAEFVQKISDMGLDIPFSNDLSPLALPVRIGTKTAVNRIVLLPMEGADGKLDGSPSELTYRRYKRLAATGPGVIWMEAVAVTHEGRGNPHQLFIHEDNVSAFRVLVDEIRESARRADKHDPVIIAQLTHSGRYSKPEGKPAPIIACHNEYLDRHQSLPSDYPFASTEYLTNLIDRFQSAAELAKEAGFDGVDLKACHGYLVGELLSAFDRDDEYGGDYEGRTRLLRTLIETVYETLGRDLMVAARINMYDGLPKPYGWGADTNGDIELSEPMRLIRELSSMVAAFSCTAGNPYYQPHINRPYAAGPYKPPEPQVQGVERLIALSRAMQDAAGARPVAGVGFSFLGTLGPHVAAGAVARGDFQLAGFGRLSFAYPEFVSDILAGREIDEGKTCVACSGCTNLMRAGKPAGCIVRDEFYRLSRKSDGTEGPGQLLGY